MHLETSSAFDIDLILNLYKNGKINKDQIIVNNGFKTKQYLHNIANLINSGFKNVIPVIDNKFEFDSYEQMVHKKTKMGIRVATEEEPMFFNWM